MSPEFSLKEPYTIRTLQCDGNPQHNWMCWKEEGKKGNTKNARIRMEHGLQGNTQGA
jgi:hypothetical protein